MGFFVQLKESVVRPKFYANIYNQGFGKTFKYLFLLFLITFIIGGMFFSFSFLTGVDKVIAEVQTKAPDFVLADGKLQVSGQQPLVYDEGNTKVVVDTTGKTTVESLSSNAGNYVLITEKEVVTQQGLRHQSYKFSDFPIEFNKDMLMEKLPYLKSILIIIGVFAFIFGLIGRLFWALVLSLGALVLDASLKTKLKYSKLYNICVYALTLPIIIELIKNNALANFPYFSIVYWGVGLIYVYLALKAIKQEEHTDPTDSKPILE
jgi:hypothetical protein